MLLCRIRRGWDIRVVWLVEVPEILFHGKDIFPEYDTTGKLIECIYKDEKCVEIIF